MAAFSVFQTSQDVQLKRESTNPRRIIGLVPIIKNKKLGDPRLSPQSLLRDEREQEKHWIMHSEL